MYGVHFGAWQRREEMRRVTMMRSLSTWTRGPWTLRCHSCCPVPVPHGQCDPMQIQLLHSQPSSFVKNELTKGETQRTVKEEARTLCRNEIAAFTCCR